MTKATHTHYSLFLFLVHACDSDTCLQARWEINTGHHPPGNSSVFSTLWIQLGTFPISRPNLTSAFSLCSRSSCPDANEIKASDWGLDFTRTDAVIDIIIIIISFRCVSVMNQTFMILFNGVCCVCCVCFDRHGQYEVWMFFRKSGFVWAHAWKDMMWPLTSGDQKSDLALIHLQCITRKSC